MNKGFAEEKEKEQNDKEDCWKPSHFPFLLLPQEQLVSNTCQNSFLPFCLEFLYFILP